LRSHAHPIRRAPAFSGRIFVMSVRVSIFLFAHVALILSTLAIIRAAG
jgi:hypothetical protein